MNDLPSLNDFIQAERLLKISTSLGHDAFLMEGFRGTEMVNGLFEFAVSVRAKRDDVKPEEIVGERVDVSLDIGGGLRRSWNALVTALDEEPRLTRGLRNYVLTLRPDIWLLSQKSDCRIWQNRTAVEVVETLLSEHGLPAPDTAGVHSPPPPHEYDVQWNETDLAYLLRRLEEDGIHYWIRQEDGAQRLVLADSAAGWDKGADGDTGLERFAFGSTDRNHVNSWRRRFSFTPGKRAGRDWNFETPGTVPGAGTPSTVKLPRNGDYELYEYPARALDAPGNERASKLRMQSVEADHEAANGGSTVRTLAPGAQLTLYDVAHPEHRFETAAVLLVHHEAADPTYETGPGEPSYENRFTAIPARLPATPHRSTTRPRIDGSQIAVIAGPEGEEIHTDQYGRVKLWFPWDRRAKRDGSDTKWVRVAQPWAGGAWGTQVIPRIGMEAVVSFEGGDPDRPIVTALVPNPQNKVPYDLPANKTRMVMKSNTHKGTGYNELRFEDEAGREELFVHAQRDMNLEVRNNQAQDVGGNQHVQIMQNATHFAGGFEARYSGLGHMLTTGGTLSMSSGRTSPLSLIEPAFFALGGTILPHFSNLLTDPEENTAFRPGSISMNSAAEFAAHAEGDVSIGAEESVSVSAQETVTFSAGEAIRLTAGQSIMTYAGGNYVIASDAAMILRAGASEIILRPDGEISIKGTLIRVEGNKICLN